MNIKQSIETRAASLDVLKTISIFLVVVYHAQFYDLVLPKGSSFSALLTYFLHGIASCAVPIFLMVSGYISLGRQISLKSVFVRLAKIYALCLIWSCLNVFIYYAAAGVPESVPAMLKQALFLKQGVNDHFWFLFALVAANICLPVLIASRSDTDGSALTWIAGALMIFVFGQWLVEAAVSTGLFILGRDMSTERIYLPLSEQGINPFGGHVFALCYFVIGGCIKVLESYTARVSTAAYGLLILFSFVALFVYGVIRSQIGNAPYDTVWYGYSSLPTLIASVAAFALTSRLIAMRSNRFLAFIGRNTLGIYTIHMPVIWLLKPRLTALVEKGYLIGLGFSLLVCSASLSIIWICVRLPVIERLFRI